MSIESFKKIFSDYSADKKINCPMLFAFDSIDSTNDFLREHASEGLPEGCVAIAKQQTNGHGRSGRTFYSPKGGNLYLSILLRPSSLSDMGLYTPAAAVAVCRAIATVCKKDTEIKWVNDIYYKERKVCGILAQGFNLDSDNDKYIVLGIGVNVCVGAENVPEEIRGIYGSLYEADELDAHKDSDSIIAMLAAEIFYEYMKIYTNINSSDFVSEYRKKSMVIGKWVSYLDGNNDGEIFIRDIDDKCRLVIERKDGSSSVYSDGEIRIKMKK